MLPKKQILIVEDNSLNREMLTEILAGEYSVLEAGNGQEALELLRTGGDEIALILPEAPADTMPSAAAPETVARSTSTGIAIALAAAALAVLAAGVLFLKKRREN